MLLFGKPLSSLAEADLLALVRGQVLEDKHLEYKRTLPGGSNDDKKEFLADVSSFANADGGVILYGVAADKGVPTAADGLAAASIDADKLRLEQIVATGIEPRIPGVALHVVTLASGNVVLAIGVPRSLAMPHRVKASSRFFARHSGDKYELDVGELRAAFTGTETLAERARAFWVERLTRLIAGETPLVMPTPAKLVLHLLPMRSFAPGFVCDLVQLSKERLTAFLPPSGRGAYTPRHMFDGLLRYLSVRDSSDPLREQTNSYVQLFRNGCLEAVDTCMLATYLPAARNISSVIFEQDLIGALENGLKVQAALDIDPPYYVLAAMLNVRGYVLNREYHRYWPGAQPIDREHLIFPEIIVEDVTRSPAEMLRPVCDALWNACGFEKSPNFNEAGQWQPQP